MEKHILLLSLDDYDRGKAEDFENQSFESVESLMEAIGEGVCYCYPLTDFMDGINNHDDDVKEEPFTYNLMDSYWMSYVNLKTQ